MSATLLTRPCLAESFLFSCELGAVRDSVTAVCQFLAVHGISEKDRSACELALVEACNNAVVYAGAEGCDKPVEVHVLCNSSDLELQVLDHTPGFDWPEVAALPAVDAERGRGLFIIQSLMQSTLYLRGQGQNRLVMRRRLTGEQRPLALAMTPKEAEQKLALNHRAITSMAVELCSQILNARTQAQDADNRLLAHELEIARQIQQSLLPRKFPSLRGFGLAGYCLSARQVGGDFYDVLPLENGAVLLVIADVMGKGVPAALFAATFRTLIRTMAKWTQRPAELLNRANQLMFDELSCVDMFLTAQIAVADCRNRKLSVANAGHCPLLITDHRQQVRAVSPDGMPLGILSALRFKEEVLSLEPGSCALLYTDGLTDVAGAAGERFGYERLLGWLRRNRKDTLTAVQLKEAFLAELAQFQSGVPLKDDQTFLILAEETAVSSETLPWNSKGDSDIDRTEVPSLGPTAMEKETVVLSAGSGH